MPWRKFYCRRRYNIRQQCADREWRRDIEARAPALLFRQDIRYYIKYRCPEHGLAYSVEPPDYTHSYIALSTKRHKDIRTRSADKSRAYHFIWRDAVAKYSAEYLTRSVAEEVDSTDKPGVRLRKHAVCDYCSEGGSIIHSADIWRTISRPAGDKNQRARRKYFFFVLLLFHDSLQNRDEAIITPGYFLSTVFLPQLVEFGNIMWYT